MTIIIPLPAILAGIVAGFLYHALSEGWIIGVTAPFLPLFVLAMAGMTFGRSGMTVATMVAIPLILLSLPFYEALLTITTQLIPLALFVRSLMVAVLNPDPPSLTWAPVGNAVAILCLYGALLYAFIIGTQSGLYSYISETMLADIKKGFTTLDPNMAAALEGMVSKIPHLLLAIEFWIWSLMMFGIVVLAHMVADTMGYSRRPSLKLAAHTPPDMVLAIFGLACVLGAIGTESLMHAGQAASIILLIPYFFSGLGCINARLRQLPNPTLWISGFYFLFFLFTVWPLIMVTMYGLVRHLGKYTFSMPPRPRK
jgi:hypothetical protein